MNILLLGSSGLLGRQIYQTLKKKNVITNNGLYKRQKELTTKKNIRELLLKKKYDLIINAAAITNINYCEKNKNLSEKVNFNIIRDIFLIKKRFNLNFKFIQFSTDQVYNSPFFKLNKENARTVVFNEYTRQKLKAEKICKKNGCLIFRTNFFAYKNKSLFKWIIDKAYGNKKYFLFNDIYFNPLRIKTICKVLNNIILNKKLNNSGIYNLGSKNILSKSDFALKIIKRLKISKSNHVICSSKKIFKIKRPYNMSMNVCKFENKFKISLPKIENEIFDEIKENVKN